MSRVASTTAPEGAVIPPRHPKAPGIGTKIPSHFGHCFGCGDLHPTGLHLVAHAGEGANLTAEFTVTHDHQGAPGVGPAGPTRSAARRLPGLVTFTAHVLDQQPDDHLELHGSFRKG